MHLIVLSFQGDKVPEAWRNVDYAKFNGIIEKFRLEVVQNDEAAKYSKRVQN